MGVVSDVLTVNRMPTFMAKRRTRPQAQPEPTIEGITRHMVQRHALRLFRDVYPERPLTQHEWRLTEEDLARKLESVGF